MGLKHAGRGFEVDRVFQVPSARAAPRRKRKSSLPFFSHNFPFLIFLRRFKLQLRVTAIVHMRIIAYFDMT